MMKRIWLLGLIVGLLVMGLGIGRAYAAVITYLYDITDSTVTLGKVDATYTGGLAFDTYEYVVTNLGYGSGLEKFRVFNTYNFPITFSTTPSGWSTTNWTGAGDWYFQWGTVSDSIALGASKTFAITTTAGSIPGLQKADIWDGPANQGTGKTLSPTPEPTSLLLLGAGLLGVALMGVARRRKI